MNHHNFLENATRCDNSTLREHKGEVEAFAYLLSRSNYENLAEIFPSSMNYLLENANLVLRTPADALTKDGKSLLEGLFKEYLIKANGGINEFNIVEYRGYYYAIGYLC